MVTFFIQKISYVNLLRLLLLFVSTLSFLSACTSEDESTSDNILKISVGAAPQTLDPHLVSGVPAIKVLEALSESLVDLDLDTYEIIPGAAESWLVSDDGLSYVFKLRKNARWSNGDRVRANDYVYAWRRAFMPSVGWLYALDYYFIVGAEAIHTGESKDLTTLGVRAIDESTLVFELNKPYPLFLKQLSSNRSAPIHQRALETHGAIDDVGSKWTNPGNYVTNGPFKLKSWELNKIIVLEKNPYYWDAEAVKLDEIHIYPIESEALEERAFRSGQIQVAHGGRIPVDKIASYKEKQPDKLRIVNGFATYFYNLNVSKPPLDNVLVRRALAHAIDRESLVHNITKAGELPASAFNPPLIPAYNALLTPLKYDIAHAKTLLSEAGYPNGEGFPTLTLSYNTSELHRKVALAVQQMWRQNLGIDVELENQEWKVFLNTRKNLQFDIARAGSVSDIADPQDFLFSYTSGHGMNDSGWSNPEYDTLVKKAAYTVDESERYKLLAEAEETLLKEMPLIPFFYSAYSYLIANNVKNLKFNALERIRFKDIYIDHSQLPAKDANP